METNDKVELKTPFQWKNGVKFTWDESGNYFVSMPVNNIPKKQFDDWINMCTVEYSGKRWDMIFADRLKAQAYDNILATMPDENNLPEHTNVNPDGLLNPDLKETDEVDKNGK